MQIFEYRVGIGAGVSVVSARLLYLGLGLVYPPLPPALQVTRSCVLTLGVAPRALDSAAAAAHARAACKIAERAAEPSG